MGLLGMRVLVGKKSEILSLKWCMLASCLVSSDLEVQSTVGICCFTNKEVHSQSFLQHLWGY